MLLFLLFQNSYASVANIGLSQEYLVDWDMDNVRIFTPEVNRLYKRTGSFKF